MLRSYYAVGIDRWGAPPPVDPARHEAVALRAAREGIVLLKNDGILPIASGTARIAVIGGHSDIGVLSGGGSSQVTPPGGFALRDPMGGRYAASPVRYQSYLPTSPLASLRAALPQAEVQYDAGAFLASATDLARHSDLAIVFVTRHECEGFDSPDMSLPFGQDALVQAVAEANPNTVVVLETGNPVAMPWHGSVKAIVEAWYPGQAGGQAIADVLVGRVNPSGRLPITFPVSAAQTPHAELPGFGQDFGQPLTVNYREGAEVGYRWFARTGDRALYAFGHGLSYTTFSYGPLQVRGGSTVSATLTVTNTGTREGADVPQLYLVDAPDGRRMRLLGFQRANLKPGESVTLTITADPRLLARYDTRASRWRIAGGSYVVALGRAADSIVEKRAVRLSAREFGR